MSIFKSISKLLSSDKKNDNYLDSSTNKEIKVEELVGENIGLSEDGQINVGIQELSGYLFLEAFFLTKANIKTFDGAKLTFFDDSENFTLKSDTQEIKSELSGNKLKYITQISFDITEKDIEVIKKGKFSKIQLDFKKKSLVFNKSI